MPAAIFGGLTFLQFLGWSATAAALFMTASQMNKSSMEMGIAKKASDAGRLITQRDVDTIRPLIYGKTRVGVNQVFVAVAGEDNKYLHMILTLGEGELNQIVLEETVHQIFLNEKLYTESDYTDFHYEFFSGTSTQNVCSTLNTAYPAWTDTQRYTSYLYCRLTYNRDLYVGIPKISVVVEGLKVKDFSTESDYNLMPMVYTNNIAYCVYDLLTRPSVRGGKEIDPTRINLTSFREAATYYNSYGWTCNMVLNKNQSVEDNLALLLANGRSEIIYSNSKFELRFRDTREESVVMQISEDDIIQNGKESTIDIAPAASLFTRPNAIKTVYGNADKKYIQDEYTFCDDNAYNIEGDYRELSIELLGLSSLDKVIPMSNYYLERTRWGNVVNMVVGNKGIILEPMDLVEITHRMPSWTDSVKPLYRVEATQLLENGNVVLSLMQEHNDLYNDDYDIDIQELFITNLLSPSAVVAPVINIVATEEVYYYRDRSFTRLKIDFDPPPIEIYPFWDYAEIWLKIGNSDYKFMTKVTSDYLLDPVEEGKRYYIKIRSVNIFGVKEDFDIADVISKEIIGKIDLPNSMSSITVVASGDTVSIYGDKISSPDIAGYEIRIGDAWVGGLFIAFNETPNFRISGVKPGTFTFWCKPKDNNGNYSQSAASATATIFYPANYIDKNNWSWDYNSIGTYNNTEYIFYNGNNCLKCSHTTTTGTLLDEDCNDISDWFDDDQGNGVSEVAPTGQFRFDTNTISSSIDSVAARHRYIATVPNQCVFEIKIYHDNIGDSNDNDHFEVCLGHSTNLFDCVFTSEGIFVYNINTWIEIGNNLVKYGGSADWQTWKFDLDFSNLQMDIYLTDSTHTNERVADNQSFSYVNIIPNFVGLYQYGTTTSGMVTHVDHVKLQYTPALTGTWISPEYDLGSLKTVRVWGDFLTIFVNSLLTWQGIFGSDTWADKINLETHWYELLSPDVAAIINAKIKWGTVTGVYPNEAKFFEILAPEFEARYLQVEIAINDPDYDSNLYLKELNCKAAYWS